ncbi:hypothetical protein Btru_055289 [Bulinus truncatus]|nr:hypothetical protein Btru_055289 [Bulinus truncatus]
MALSEVFRPSDGDLLIRDQLSHGPTVPVDHFKKDELRPQTQGGFRFGQLSHNSFFTRHNPHPTRVRHFKGLLDVPICTVNDDGYFANPRYSLQFPPSNFDNTKLKTWRGRVPVNAININSQMLPINTITGLQYFTGLNSYPFREKAIPRVGLVPVTEAWRDELTAFTRSLLEDNEILQRELASQQRPEEEKRPRSTMYSPDTGRLIPPPSRAMSRSGSRRGRGNQQFLTGNLQHISADPDLENIVMVMLCQILQTDDINAVQAWLCSAGTREKELVMGLVKTAIAGKEEYYKQYPVEFIPDNGKDKLPPINGKSSSGEVNRLVIDDAQSEMKTDVWQKVQSLEQKQETNFEPLTKQNNETQESANVSVEANKDTSEGSPPVKPASPTLRRSKTMPLQPARLQPKQEKSSSANEKPTGSTKKPAPGHKTQLKYSKAQTNDKKEPMWYQNQSLNTF